MKVGDSVVVNQGALLGIDGKVTDVDDVNRCCRILAAHGFYTLPKKWVTVSNPKPREPMLEWVDPETNEEYRCPKKFVAGLLKNLKHGKTNAQTASILLASMSETDTSTNQRHLRQAALYLKQLGVHVISYRSVEGGYFIADTQNEVKQYTDEQRKIARSMIAKADRMDAVTVSDSILVLNYELTTPA